MKFNVGIADRVLRMVAGIVALYFGYTMKSYLLGFFGGVLILTASVGFCPLYALFKLNSCGTHKDHSDKPPKDDELI